MIKKEKIKELLNNKDVQNKVDESIYDMSEPVATIVLDENN